jgi:cysteine synthase A
MRYYESYQELIGGTPLVRLNHMDFPAKLNVFAKMELLNPSGSLKDRTCKAIIAAAEKAGSLKRGDTIVEITSGNTGISFAFVGLNKGYKFIFVVPEKFSQEKNDIMRALGARIINTPLEKGMEGAFEKVRELLHQDPHMV